MRVLHVVGARPNFVKIAPIMQALEAHHGVHQSLVHTGQHYDPEMSQVFFDDLGLRTPDVRLDIHSDLHGVQTGRMMVELEHVLLDLRPDLVVVVGDVDSTMAAALVAVKLHIPCAHVEAGLRSFDRTMPEEINRIVADAISDLLLTPSPDADENLIAEGVPSTAIHRIGNVMIDTLLSHLDRAKARAVPERFDLVPHEYALATIHRRSNVDDSFVLSRLIDALSSIQSRIPIVLPLHPRTRRKLEASSLIARVKSLPNVRLSGPLGYLDFLSLTASSKFVMTDSGGLQEETTALGIPCLTLRSRTERPITVSVGTNTVVGSDPLRIDAAASDILEGRGKLGAVPELWDGHASRRAAKVLVDHLRLHRAG